MGKLAFIDDRSDLRAFSAFLSSGRAPEDAMSPPELDGFLAGIAAGPEPIAVAEWLPKIWGGKPRFAGRAEEEAVHDSILYRFSEIMVSLQEFPESYDVLLHETEDGGVYAGAWVDGFLAAVRLRPAPWLPLFADEEACVLIVPLLLASGDETIAQKAGLDISRIESVSVEAIDYLPYCVRGLHDFWHERGGGAAAPRRVVKVGRNEPCPCGSGRKYKRCCAV